MKTIAQALDFGEFKGFGPLGNPGTGGVNIFSNFISSAVGLMTVIAFIWFVFSFITGAIGIMTAGSDKQALENARKRIVSGIIGVVVVISAIFVISLIGTLFGIPVLNLPELFNRVTGASK